MPVVKSFDDYYNGHIAEIDELYSDAAFLMFASSKCDTGIDDKYRAVLLGLVSNLLNTFGAAVILLRHGLYKQAMVLIRQVVEISSTMIHIVTDPDDKAIERFASGKYESSKSVGQAKKAVPIIGHFWGFLSNTYVHINAMNSEPHTIKPFQNNDEAVVEIITCLRMTCWIAYLSVEIAFPNTLAHNRYWKHHVHEGRHALAYDPDESEREWAARFLKIANVTATDLSSEVCEDDISYDTKAESAE
jgi:hypothetical protein